MTSATAAWRSARRFCEEIGKSCASPTFHRVDTKTGWRVCASPHCCLRWIPWISRISRGEGRICTHIDTSRRASPGHWMTIVNLIRPRPQMASDGLRPPWRHGAMALLMSCWKNLKRQLEWLKMVEAWIIQRSSEWIRVNGALIDFKHVNHASPRLWMVSRPKWNCLPCWRARETLVSAFPGVRPVYGA